MVKPNVKCNNGKLKHAPPDHNDLRKRSSARVTRKPRVCTRQVGQKPSGKLQFGAEARALPEIGAILTPMPGPRGSPWTRPLASFQQADGGVGRGPGGPPTTTSRASGRISPCGRSASCGSDPDIGPRVSDSS